MSIDRRDIIVGVIVVQFITVDGIVSDPDGSGETPADPESAERVGAAVLTRFRRAAP